MQLKKYLFNLICALFSCVLVLFLADYSSAQEIRGLRVVAKDEASGEQKELKIYNRSYAVIIGIDQYRNLPYDMQLSYAVQDAKGMEMTLKNNFKFDKIITLYNEEATKENIMKVLSGDLTKETSQQDAVFVFWAGHGYTEKTPFGDLGYLVPYDGTFVNSELYKNISMTALKDDISKRIPAKHVLYVMDACYSGLLATTRGAVRRSSRDYNYLEQITTEKVRQVLTAGDKDQEVLDGGPGGHSVFTGRLIEILENADDYITATEISTTIKEKVFSDARARNHTQTPRYGELFGVGDFVFIPSMETKVDDTQAKIANLQKELEYLTEKEQAARRAQDHLARRQADLEKRAIEAKLRNERLKQQALEEEINKRENEEKERQRQENELQEKWEANERRLTSLRQEVMNKRKALQKTSTGSLDTTIIEMKEINSRIHEIMMAYRDEYMRRQHGIDEDYASKVATIKKDQKGEFESRNEYETRVKQKRDELTNEYVLEYTQLRKDIEREYYEQIDPLLDMLRDLFSKEFILTGDDVILQLQKYDAEKNTYPVTVKLSIDLNGKQIKASARMAMPREEAKTFKQHFQNDMLEVQIKGSLYSLSKFRFSQASIIDLANNKKYDLVSEKTIMKVDDNHRYDEFNNIFYNSKADVIYDRDSFNEYQLFDGI